MLSTNFIDKSLRHTNNIHLVHTIRFSSRMDSIGTNQKQAKKPIVPEQKQVIHYNVLSNLLFIKNKRMVNIDVLSE